LRHPRQAAGRLVTVSVRIDLAQQVSWLDKPLLIAAAALVCLSVSAGKSIRLYLADGTPGGLLTAEIMN
jgi:hypothetical protein